MVEVLVAVAVLAIGAASLYSGIGYGFRCVAQIREERRATQILLETTEIIRLYTWDQLHNPNFLPPVIKETYNPGDEKNPGVVYTNRITIASLPPDVENYLNNLSQVTIALDWISAGSSRHREITTFIAHRGLRSYVY